MTDFLTAVGLAIAIEGIVYALFPEAMQRFMARMMEQPPQALRAAGMFAAVAGVLMVWWVRH